MARAWPASRAASSASPRSRSRSVGASSTGEVSAESGRRVVARRTSSGVEQRLDVVPERARLARAAVVVGRLAHEIEPPRRARARRVEQVTVARDGVGPRESRPTLVELTPRVVVEKRRAATSPRQAALLQPEHERRFEAPRARAQEIDDGNAADLVTPLRPEREPLDRGKNLLAASVPASSRQPSSSARSRTSASYARRSRRLASSAGGRSVPCAFRSIRVTCSRTAATGSSAARNSSSAGNGAPRSFSDSSTTRSGFWIARPRRRPSTKSTRTALEPGERRAEVCEEVVARPARPREAEERGERLAERCLRNPHLPVDRVRDAELAEHGVEDATDAVDAGHDDADLLRRRACADE